MKNILNSVILLILAAFGFSACGAKNAYNAQKCQEGSAKHCVLYLEKVRSDLEKEMNKKLNEIERQCKKDGICDALE